MIFSADNQNTFDVAENALKIIRQIWETKPLVLVANKIDLVRHRVISEEGNVQINDENENLQ